MTKRKDYIDTAKFWAIFLLFIEHSQLFANFTGYYKYLKIWICSCHMALFFITFGMVASNSRITSKKDAVSFVNKRYRGLMVPYFLWSFIYASSLNGKAFAGILYGTNPSLGYACTNSVFWFLPAMFCATILFQILVNIGYYFETKREIVFGIELMVCSAISLLLKSMRPNMGFVWGIDISFTGVVLMLIGLLLRPLIDKMYELEKSKILSLSLVCLLIGGLCAQFNTPDESWVSIMALAYYGKLYWGFIILAVISSLGIIGVSMLLEKCRLFTWLGRNSLLLMTLHFVILSRLVTLCQKYFGVLNMAVAILCATICMAICVPLVYLINKFAPVLKGKE